MRTVYPRDRIFNPNLMTIKISYNPERVKIAENLMQEILVQYFASWIIY